MRKQAIIKARQGVEVTEGLEPLTEKEALAWEQEKAAGEVYYEKIQAELNGN